MKNRTHTVARFASSLALGLWGGGGAFAQPAPAPAEISPNLYVIYAPDGSCKITIDTTQATDMTDWAEHTMAPVLAEWYPKICALIPTPRLYPADQLERNFRTRQRRGGDQRHAGDRQCDPFSGTTRQSSAPARCCMRRCMWCSNMAGRGATSCPEILSSATLPIFLPSQGKLKDKADPVSAFLEKQLTAEEQNALAHYTGAGPADYTARTNLVIALNRIIAGPEIYDPAIFKNVTLRDSTTRLRDGKPEGRRNRSR